MSKSPMILKLKPQAARGVTRPTNAFMRQVQSSRTQKGRPLLAALAF
jgi:hypothetical protein